MARKNVGGGKSHAYAAYRLGCLPFVLLEGFGMQLGLASEFARDRVGFVDWAVTEGLEAINSLREFGHGNVEPQAETARQAITARWEGLKQRYYRSKTSSETPADKSLGFVEPCVLDWYAGSRDQRWKAVSDAVTSFHASLRPPAKTFASLGSAVADIFTWCIYDPNESMEAFRSAAARLHSVLSGLADEELLFGLEVDLSPNIGTNVDEDNLMVCGSIGLCKAKGGRSHTEALYQIGVKGQVLFLHDDILKRLKPSSGSSELPEWITATQAIELAKRFGVGLTLVSINKSSKKQPPEFVTRPQGNRRYVKFDSFVKFLLQKNPLKHDDGVADDEAETRKKAAMAKKKQEREQ